MTPFNVPSRQEVTTTNQEIFDNLQKSLVVMNYVHNLTQIPIDFPVAPELETVGV